MKSNVKISGSAILCCILLISQAALCQIRLPFLISDGMVLQRNADVKIWGWADNPEGANLYNKEGLPASPFGTDE
jgi:hypothetical protein